MPDSSNSEAFPSVDTVRRSGSWNTIVYWIGALLATAGLCYHTLALAWWGDDAFISFAYARNLARGMGLVYNAGERVEGYTNFLWTIMIAGAMKSGIDPMVFTKYAGTIFHAGTVVLYAWAGWRIRTFRGTFTLALPLTALALAVHHEFSAYGTSGLETAMFAFGVSLLYVVTVFADRARAPFLAGCASLFLLMNRPDGLIFAAPAAVYLVVREGWKPSVLMKYVFPLLAVYFPYWCWRFWYYGMPFPNTFYAKSIADPYPSQGFAYAMLFYSAYPVFLVLPALLLYAINSLPSFAQSARQVIGGKFKAAIEDPLNGGVMLALVFIALQAGFTILIGGDFMFGRFFIMIIPLTFFSIEIALIRFSRPLFRYAVAAAVVGGAAIRTDVFDGKLMNGWIADEQAYYTRIRYADEQRMGEEIKSVIGDAHLRIAFGGAMAAIVYYMDPQLAIDAATGLNDSTIAHQRLEHRGRPGHEKRANTEYIQRRGVNLFMDLAFPYKPGDIASASIYGVPTILMHYDNTLMKRLGALPAVKYTPIEPYLDSAIASLPGETLGEAQREYARLKPFYFEVNGDTARESAFIRRLALP